MDNRSNILSCALRLFATRGYDAVGVQEIVEAAGITKPTLYYFYESKEGIYRALLHSTLDEFGSIVDEALHAAEDLRAEQNHQDR